MAIVGAKLINPESIENALVKAFEAWANEDINKAHWDDQFKEMSLWDYDNETRRKNGEVVDTPRDIYDLGALYKSGIKSLNFEKTGGEVSANWHWNATNASGKEYAMYVHEGLGTNVTARPFTDDISVASSFFKKAPGMAFNLQVRKAMAAI